MKHTTQKNIIRALIFVGLVGLSYLAGHYISVATSDRLYLGSFSLFPLATWAIERWANLKTGSYGATGALMGVVTFLCLWHCRDTSEHYYKRNKQFKKIAAFYTIFHIKTLAGGAVFTAFLVDIFENSLLFSHMLHFLPLLAIQVVVLLFFLVLPTRHWFSF
ncbi:MAG: hypothetical protein FWC92_08160 [Defluviitaleaceae bacterium]|nr:hypothetical protein [Defluviitaleaceae bacterium]